MGVKVQGVEQVKAALKAECLRISKLGSEVLREAVEPMAQRMRENLEPHRRTGKTIEDVQIVDLDQPAPGVVAVAVGLTAGKRGRDFIGRFLEEGTSHQPAQPWARPAVDAEQPNLLERMAIAYRKRL